MKKTLMVSETEDEEKRSRELAWIIVIIGFILAMLGLGGSVTFKTDDKLIFIVAVGFTLMIFGVLLWRVNTRYELRLS